MVVSVEPSSVPGSERVLTDDALNFVAELHHRFSDAREEALTARVRQREQASARGRLDFLAETADVRAGEWAVAPPPADLRDRRVEITGPTTRKMSINALNSGAQIWLADLEDANTPHWTNVVDGQVNLLDAVRRELAWTSDGGKSYHLNEGRLATIVVRPRGWHLDERHIQVDGRPVAGALVDFGLYFFHNAVELIARGSGPYFYLPKMESHREARLWNEIFCFAQEALGVPQGTVRATVLIETIPAAFEMEEILYELRDHASGLNAGRWDYLFSMIKYFRDSGEGFILPDRNTVTMTAPFMRAYAQLLVKTCHRRGAMAIGGMSAYIPAKSDPVANELAFAKVRDDKEREAGDGFDGSWVAHPGLVPVCREAFDAVLDGRLNQLERRRDDVHVGAGDLLDLTSMPGSITRAGLEGNVRVAIAYLEEWLRGSGAVAIDNLMEDAATAEIARSQVWQWLHNGSQLEDGTPITTALVFEIVDQQLNRLRREAGDRDEQFEDARKLFEEVALTNDFVEFLTLAASRGLA